MLLAIDCGNTHLVMGLYEGEDLLFDWRVATDTRRTEDEYYVLLCTLLAEHGWRPQQIDGVVIASVVPGVNFSLTRLAQKYLHQEPLFVSYATDIGIPILMDNPREVGADRIINALAGHQLYGGMLIIVDFGTATTFDCVTPQGEYIGGAIVPGIDISQQALFSRAAKLSDIGLYRPSQVIGKNTADCFRSGMLWGYGGQVDALVRRMTEELPEKPRVIATGGLAKLIAEYSESIDLVDPFLTLAGLRLAWQHLQGTQA